MSQHPSLRSASRSRQHRSVLKRYERIKMLVADERWKPEDSVFGLPKVKLLKIKTGKGKPAQAPATAQAEAPPGQEPTPAVTPAAKPTEGKK